tara:strand:+ start:2375 stop:3037 length:663 start_codon:yes stop_codon:yes gene_type:complete
MTKVCIIGANRGIGLALTRQYVSRGVEVIAVCRRASPELNTLKTRVIEEINVTEGRSLRQLAHQLQGEKLDLLIHNAGILHRDAFDNFDLDSLRTQFEVNTLAPLQMVRTLKNNLQAGSKVAVITSRMGSIEDNTSGGYYGYRVSKAGVNMVVKNLSLDLQAEQIAVGVFHPGYVQTDMTGQRGDVSADECAHNLVARFDGLSMATTGQFFHAKGEALPW